MDYPTIEEVEVAGREQIYRWFLGLPVPKWVKEGKKETARYVSFPSGGREVIKRVYERWLEFGGRDNGIAEEIISELWPKRESGKSQ